MNHQKFSILRPALFQFDSNGSSYVRSNFSSVPADSLVDRDSLVGVAESESAVIRPIDPMLLVFEERRESIRMLLRWIGSVYRSAARTPAA